MQVKTNGMTLTVGNAVDYSSWPDGDPAEPVPAESAKIVRARERARGIESGNINGTDCTEQS